MSLPRPRTFQRTSYRPGALCQFDLWEPTREIPVGCGQTRRGYVVVGCLPYSRAGASTLVFSKQAPDLLYGIGACLAKLGRLPETLVWDREGALHARTRRARFCRDGRASLDVGSLGDVELVLEHIHCVDPGTVPRNSTSARAVVRRAITETRHRAKPLGRRGRRLLRTLPRSNTCALAQHDCAQNDPPKPQSARFDDVGRLLAVRGHDLGFAGISRRSREKRDRCGAPERSDDSCLVVYCRRSVCFPARDSSARSTPLVAPVKRSERPTAAIQEQRESTEDSCYDLAERSRRSC